MAPPYFTAQWPRSLIPLLFPFLPCRTPALRSHKDHGNKGRKIFLGGGAGRTGSPSRGEIGVSWLGCFWIWPVQPLPNKYSLNQQHRLMWNASRIQHMQSTHLFWERFAKAKMKTSHIRYPYIFPGNIMEQIHKGARSRHKKVSCIRHKKVTASMYLIETNCTWLVWLSPVLEWCAQWTRWRKQWMSLILF